MPVETAMPADRVLMPLEARKTYRYLRVGMIGAVVLLAVSIGIERSKVDCWQTSISAYYYTPVRAIFVGAMMAVGLSLIVYKGRGWEDLCLNAAGMLAPLVAVAPTTDVGVCWSIAPLPKPKNADGELALWVTTNIDNNVLALLITGAIGLVAAVVIAIIVKMGARRKVEWERGTAISLGVTAAGLAAVWWLLGNWDDFDSRAHGFAAVLMFVFLTLAIVAQAASHRDERDRPWFWIYAAIAVLMVAGGALIALTRVFGDHTVFALEAYEIALFAIYWGAQTAENWDERVVPTAAA